MIPIPASARRDPAFGGHKTITITKGTEIRYFVVFDEEFDVIQCIAYTGFDVDFEQFHTVEDLNVFLASNNLDPVEMV